MFDSINCSTASVPAGRLLKIATALHNKCPFEETTEKLAQLLNVLVKPDDCIRLGYEGTYL